MKATIVRTTALDTRSRPRLGEAAREERICPEEYSPVMMRAPRTATTICPNVRPEVIKFLAMSWCCSDCPKAAARPAPKRTVRAMVMKEVIQVERRVQNLIHSARTERRMVWRPCTRRLVGRGMTLLAALAGVWKAGRAEACAGALAVMTGLSGAR